MPQHFMLPHLRKDFCWQNYVHVYVGHYGSTACRLLCRSRMVSYRSRVALYVVVVVSVMAAKHVSSHVIATPFLCRCRVESSSFDKYTLGHTIRSEYVVTSNVSFLVFFDMHCVRKKTVSLYFCF